MFLESTIIVFTEALKEAFDGEHPEPLMRNIDVRVDYPLEETDYPSLWVNFVPQGNVRNVGIGHVEHVEAEDGMHRFFAWNFSGVLEITVCAMTSLERARMIDWVCKTIAFGRPDTNTPMRDFRRYVDTNDLVGLRMLWDSFAVGGSAETPGTPWGTDDVIYEITASLTVEGEFRYDPDGQVLVPLSAITVEDPQIAIDPLTPPPADEGWR